MENKMEKIIYIMISVLFVELVAMSIQSFELKIINIAYAMYIVLFVLIVNFILKIAGER
jgi:hypothetical protein